VESGTGKKRLVLLLSKGSGHTSRPQF
jgi:hypothetical protein